MGIHSFASANNLLQCIYELWNKIILGITDLLWYWSMLEIFGRKTLEEDYF